MAASLVAYAEWPQWAEIVREPQRVFAYPFNADTTWPMFLLLVAPLCWWLSRRGDSVDRADSGDGSFPPGRKTSAVRGGLAAAMFFAFSSGITALLGSWAFDAWPPAYHDEYSYRFQAETFLAGRPYFPSPPHADFFDQMHVLNDDGVFASRFFPGVGLWLAPWVAAGRPYWASWLAAGLATLGVFWLGRLLASTAVGVVAAILMAMSPALLLFGNTLLSHLPTVVGLLLFAVCYLRALASAGLTWPALGGVALAFAMCCRPLTAFGFAMPFAVHLIWHTARGRLPRARARWLAAVLPVSAGIVLLGAYHWTITGSPIRSPYGKYTQIYTPCHTYGFYNVTRGKQQLGPKVLANYDRWAEELTDLTPWRAVRLTALRVLTSSQWTIGCATAMWLGGVFLAAVVPAQPRWALPLAALAGVHAVYFPFAFEGIFGLSYAFETVPILCLAGASAACWVVGQWWRRRLWLRLVWFAGFCAVGFAGPVPRLVRSHRPGEVETHWEAAGPLARLQQGIGELAFARRYYAMFEARLAQAGVQPPALVFIRPDPSDRHRDLVTNSPSLDGPILRAHDRGDRNQDLMRAMPNRAVWRFDARHFTIERLR